VVDVKLYGGKRGFLEHVRTRALYALGAYRSGRNIEWSAVERLAFVCKGNICRSPYACARARSLGVNAASFGLDAVDGAPANPAALANARVRGIDLSDHLSARVPSTALTRRDLVIVFEPEQMSQVRLRIGDDAQVTLLGVWSRPVRPHIQDPYGLGDRYFQHCFAIIDSSIAVLVEQMAKVDVPRVPRPRDRVAGEGALHGDPRDGTLS